MKNLCFLVALAFLAFSPTLLLADGPDEAVNAALAPSVEPENKASGCAPLAASFTDPVLLSGCLVQVECEDGSVVSCTGNNTCSTGGTNNRCVICDGVNQGCCAKTCCENCDEVYQNCLNSCGNPLPNCNICDRGYDRCVEDCTGGCSF